MSLRGQERGVALVALLVAMSVMAIVLSVALPAWQTAAQREREAELVFRGQQYARAIGLYQRKFANAAPPNVDLLVSSRFLRKKYKDPITGGDFELLYGTSQAAVNPGPAQPGAVGQGAAPRPGVTPPAPPRPGAGIGIGGGAGTAPLGGAQGGIIGVTSKSTATSIRLFNGKNKYNEWAFVWQATSRQAGVGAAGTQRPGVGPGAPGTAQPGMPNQPGRPGLPQPGGINTPGQPITRPRL